MQVWFNKAFAPVKRYAPEPVANAIRSTLTAFAAPLWQAYRNGHLRSSFKRAAVDREGKPIPWYTYPCIRQIAQTDFAGRDVLEFGGGHSTLWWQERARSVLSFEADAQWAALIRPRLSERASLQLVSPDWDIQHRQISETLAGRTFDVVIIDGLDRIGLIPTAVSVLRSGGFILFDNAEWDGFKEAWAPFGLQRVDYYGPSPGVPLQHCTSLFFADRCFLFAGKNAVMDAN